MAAKSRKERGLEILDWKLRWFEVASGGLEQIESWRRGHTFLARVEKLVELTVEGPEADLAKFVRETRINCPDCLEDEFGDRWWYLDAASKFQKEKAVLRFAYEDLWEPDGAIRVLGIHYDQLTFSPATNFGASDTPEVCGGKDCG